MRLSRLSIRTRITGGSVLIAIVIAAIAGLVIYDRVEHIVDDGEQNVLTSIEAPYRTAILNDPKESLDVPGHGEHVAVVAPDGTTRIDTLQNGLSAKIPQLATVPDGVHSIDVGDITYTVLVQHVANASGIWQIIAARNGEGQDTVLTQVLILLIVAIALIVIGFAAASWLIGTLALRPVTRLRRSAVELAARPGEELLPVGPADDEISRLAGALNELISQLRESAARERQLVSDASHELRTPLAILQTQLELAQHGDETALRRDLAAATRTLDRLSGLATSLLELSRIEAQSESGRADYADLALELADAADRGRLRAGETPIAITTRIEQGDDETPIAVLVQDFGRVADNLIGNALSAAGDGPAHIELALEHRASGAVLTVGDDAGGMQPEFVDRALTRFARASAARQGAGLGLAIVAGVARLSGGSVTLHNDPGRGLEVEVRFPIAEESERVE
jgi:two-component system, OmpR family, sensor kinase